MNGGVKDDPNIFNVPLAQRFSSSSGILCISASVRARANKSQNDKVSAITTRRLLQKQRKSFVRRDLKKRSILNFRNKRRQ